MKELITDKQKEVCENLGIPYTEKWSKKGARIVIKQYIDAIKKAPSDDEFNELVNKKLNNIIQEIKDYYDGFRLYDGFNYGDLMDYTDYIINIIELHKI